MSTGSSDFDLTVSLCFLDLMELCFRQEGWRLEHKEPTDQSSPIEFKGIVFNEMKGVFVRYIMCLNLQS